MRKRIPRTAAVAAACALVTGLVPLAASGSPAPTAVAPPVILHIGDSYSSGEGGGWKGNSTTGSGDRQGTDMATRRTSDGRWVSNPYRVYESNGEGYIEGTIQGDSWRNDCHESTTSAVHLIPAPGDTVTRTVNLACSGARTKNLWPLDSGGEATNRRRPQIEDIGSAVRFGDDVRLVVIGAGGNDAGFGDVVRLCMTAWAKKHLADIAFPHAEQKCRDQVREQVLPDLPQVYYNLVKTIKLVRQKLVSEGEQPGEYRIVLQGYPTILPTDTDGWTASEGSLYGQRCPLVKEDVEFVNRHFVTRLNQMVRAAAEETGVGFVDLTDAFAGHRLCEQGTVRGTAAAESGSRAEWVRFLDVHPNAGSVWDLIKKIAHPTEGRWPLSREDISDALNPQRHISESLHPNYWGQQAIGHCLRRYYLTTGGAAKVRCFNGAGATGEPQHMALAALPTVPHIVDDPQPDVAIPQGDGWRGPAVWRTVTVPDEVKPGQYVQLFLDIAHPRKGQLKISLVDPQGRSKLVRDFNFADTGSFAKGRWTFEHYLWDPWGVKDPSGRWKLGIWDGSPDGYQGALKAWDLKFYGP